LDFKMSGLLVVAGSVHHSGAVYTGNWDHVPGPEELPALPEAVYRVLADGGRLWTPSGKKRRVKSAVATGTPSPTSPMPYPVGTRSLPVTGRAGRRLESLLNDISHGRDVRIFCATRLMVAKGCDDETITTTVLSSPVGPRATKYGRDPIGYMGHKIICAREMVETSMVPGWDPGAYRSAAHAANLGSSTTRVVDYLLTLAEGSGVVTKSTGLIAINTAMREGTAAGALKMLREGGWLRVFREFDAKNRLPRTYGMFIPEGRQIPGGASGSPPTPHTHDGSFIPQYLSPLTGHDAFRSRAREGHAPTLHKSYEVLWYLSDTEQTTATLSRALHCDERTVQRRLAGLRRAGLVVTTPIGHRLTDQPIRPLLDRAAVSSGTAGARRAQIDRYRDEAQKNDEYRANMTKVNTPEWRQCRRRDAVKMMQSESWAGTLRLLLESGETLDSLAEWYVDRLVSRLQGQPEVWQGFLAEWDGEGVDGNAHHPWVA